MTKTIELAPPLSKPLSWEELCILIGEGSPESLAKLGRSSAQLVEYGAFLHQLYQEYDTVSDYVRIKILGYKHCLAPSGKLKADGIVSSPLQVWRLNDFPYYLEPGIQHWVYWSTHPLPTSAIEAVIREKLPGLLVVHFVNPPSLQSVEAVSTDAGRQRLLFSPQQPGSLQLLCALPRGLGS